MSSKREEERNEKIIRGLMKLPPNRRCINCNALGPQYVCTTFWTFVCMTCSGIHREFTHRVKSVSMSKFTSQEVEALQKGGNQRAREIYLKGWDTLRQRLPDNSNAEKVRTFIKNVYVDKKYAEGVSSDKPPRDLQHQRSLEGETRRASSYHSYSQSPPYDFQYEERRYGKHALVLTRKTGSDRGLYEGKFSSFLSPSRLSEDRFANDGSNSRMSDYSVSSRSDPFRSDIQSPNFQKDTRSPFSETSREFSAEDLQHHTGKDGARVLHPQRTMSAGSFGSFDSNSMSFKSVNSAGFVEGAPEPVPSMETHHNELSSSASLPRPSVSKTSDALDLFGAPFAPQNAGSAISESNRSQFPESGTPSVNLFEPLNLTDPTFSAHHPAQSLASSSLNLLLEMPQPLPTETVHETLPGTVSPQNEGWATFDSQNVTAAGVEIATPVIIPSSQGNSEGNFNPLSHVQWSSFEDSAPHRPPSSSLGLWQDNPQNVLPSCNAASTQWSFFQDFSSNGPSPSPPTVWNESQQIVGATLNTIGTQSWNAFEDSTGKLPTQSTKISSEQVEMQHPSVVDGNMAFGVSQDLSGDGIQLVAMGTELSGDGIQRAAVDTGYSFSGISSNVEAHPYETGHKPINPFDLPYDSDVDSSNMTQFWDMSALQAALPNGDIPVPFAGGVTQPWFDPAPATAYVPTGPQEAFSFMARQASGSQIPNIQTQGPVATIGGNPFA